MLTVSISSSIVRTIRWLIHSVTLNGPVENVLVLKTASVKEILKDLLVLDIVWCFLKLELSTVKSYIGQTLQGNRDIVTLWVC